MSVLTVSDLRVSFAVESSTVEEGRHEAVRGVAFELRRGRVLALVGESGSGKSVTALAGLGLLPAEATVTGSIRLEGEELIGAPARRLRQVRGGRVGTVFQEPMTAFNPMFTIGYQIAEAIRAHAEVSWAAARKRAAELLRRVGLGDPARIARSFPHQLSGGQLQRAVIAMAISGDPVLVIADEPTTALDVTIQAEILELLRTLDLSILLITHDMGVVAALADDVVVLREGEVVESSTVERLFAAPEHDYTIALLDAVPRIGFGRREPRTPERVVVTIRDVAVAYPGIKVLDGVSLDIGAGEVVGLVGESGSGKSTLARAVAGLAPLAEGSIAIEGKTVGMVFQDPASSLNPRWTVGTCIAEPLRLHTRLRKQDLRARVADLLEAVGLPASYAERHPHQMSGGQRQRVAIARALALDPALLIADEPTSALDVSVQARILELLRELQARLGFACLFISHDLAVVDQLTDRVAVMYQGRIVEHGPTAQVLDDPRHPYTRRLLSSIQRLTPANGTLEG